MGNLLAYSGTTTKIRAIRSRLFTEDDYRELASMATVTDALSFIKKHPGYHDLFAHADEASLHRNDIEKYCRMPYMWISRKSTVLPPCISVNSWICISSDMKSLY